VIATGVLVAVSIPIFTSQLEKSRESTDLANLRAAKAAAVTAYLGEDGVLANCFAATPSNATVFYNTSTGKLVATQSDANKCGKGTTTKGGCEKTTFGTYEYTEDLGVKDYYIQVTVKPTGDTTCAFVSGPSGG